MSQPATAAALAVAHNRAAVMEELRRLLPGISDSHKTLPFGLAALDSCLPEGGLPCGALHEIVPAPYAMPAALGFIAAILARFVYSPSPCGGGSGVGAGRFYADGYAHTSPRHPSPYPPPQRGKIFLILPTYEFGAYGRLYGHGLRALGLEPARLILVEPAHSRDALWAIEEAVRSGAPAAVAGIIDKLDLKTSQRLQLAATEAGLPLLLIRPEHNLESSAAATRWRVGTAEAARDRFGLFVRPRWHLALERVRNGRPGEWIVEYNHVAHRFSLAAALADPARARGTSKKADRKSHCA
jgi:protein ImuA